MERGNHLSHLPLLRPNFISFSLLSLPVNISTINPQLFAFPNKYSRRIRTKVVINLLKKLSVRFHHFARLLTECPPSQNSLFFNKITIFSWLWTKCSDVNINATKI